jgi:hypothetical protein
VNDTALIERIDALLVGGYIGKEKAAAAQAAVPVAESRILSWLRDMAEAREWARFGRFAAIGIYLHPVGLAPILLSVLALRVRGVNTEDLVGMLGELRSPEAVGPLARLLGERHGQDPDNPGSQSLSLSAACVRAMGEIGTPAAERELREIVSGDWPQELKEYAADELDSFGGPDDGGTGASGHGQSTTA